MSERGYKTSKRNYRRSKKRAASRKQDEIERLECVAHLKQRFEDEWFYFEHYEEFQMAFAHARNGIPLDSAFAVFGL